MSVEQVWRCDRCGVQYKPKTGADLRLQDSWTAHTTDFCEACAVAFEEWVAAGATEAVEA